MNTVLVVDDDRTVTSLMAAWLRKLGCLPVISFDAPDAIRVLQSEWIDAVLLDLHMPGQNGIEVIRHIRSGSLSSRIPIVVVSANEDPSVIASVILSGANLFLAKPTDFIQIEFALSRVLPSGSSAQKVNGCEAHHSTNNDQTEDSPALSPASRGHWAL
ncbi:MAG: response regulator receiver protein [Acidobacteriales bacterium]|nr:response regulator receiver protein [Terriglobales bacterium]